MCTATNECKLHCARVESSSFIVISFVNIRPKINVMHFGEHEWLLASNNTNVYKGASSAHQTKPVLHAGKIICQKIHVVAIGKS
jgi:hypothetical protein